MRAGVFTFTPPLACCNLALLALAEIGAHVEMACVLSHKGKTHRSPCERNSGAGQPVCWGSCDCRRWLPFRQVAI
jgi:hypothetical protein